MLHIICNIMLYINQFFATKYIWQLLQNWTALDIKYLKWIILLHCCHKYYSINKVQKWPKGLGTIVTKLIWIVTKPVRTLLAISVYAKIYVEYIKLSGFWITLTLMMRGVIILELYLSAFWIVSMATIDKIKIISTKGGQKKLQKSQMRTMVDIIFHMKLKNSCMNL